MDVLAILVEFSDCDKEPFVVLLCTLVATAATGSASRTILDWVLSDTNDHTLAVSNVILAESFVVSKGDCFGDVLVEVHLPLGFGVRGPLGGHVRFEVDAHLPRRGIESLKNDYKLAWSTSE